MQWMPCSVTKLVSFITKRLEFHSEYPLFDDGQNKSEPHYLVGANDTPEEKMSVLLGVWKPLSPSKV